MFSGRPLLFTLCGAALLLAARGEARDWTRFRGPNGQGIIEAAGIPVSYSLMECNWRVALPGSGHSSPVVWDDQIFVASAEPAARKRHLLCLSARDGKILWTRSYDYQVYPLHQYNTAASSTPAVDAGAVYSIWSTPDTIVVRAHSHDGRELWERDLGRYAGQHGGAGSPIVVGDRVVIANDQEAPGCFLIALDAKTGKTVWKRDRRSGIAAYSTPALYQPAGGPPQLVFSASAHGITGIDPRTGDVLWEVADVFPQRCVGSPAAAGEWIVATAGDGGGRRQGIVLRTGANGKPEIAYRLETRHTPYVPTPILYRGLLYLWGDAGVVSCLRVSDGAVLWSERVGGNYFGSPVCAGGRLYAMNSQGELVVIDAGEKFRLLGRSDLGEKSHSTPAVSGGVMYLRTESHLISLGAARRASR